MKEKTQKVLVTGAAGFVGSRLCEVMALTDLYSPVAYIHSTASAARIARFPMDIIIGDLNDRNSVERAMQGCDAVVHLARGEKAVMTKGLDNILQVAAGRRVSRFVHISSVAVYGDNPPPGSVFEDEPARRTEMEYGNIKLDQENRVLRYKKKFGLPTVILRPPNIYGPFSQFNQNMIEKIRSKDMAIVNEGRTPCNLVYVDNLVEAILLALQKTESVGQTFFVTDNNTVTWERCITDHSVMVGISVPYVVAAEIQHVPKEKIFLTSLKKLPGVLVSGEMRKVLSQVPAIKHVERILYEKFQTLPDDTKQSIRLAVNGPDYFIRENTSKISLNFSNNLIAAQLRTVAHSNDKARRILKYIGSVSYSQGMFLTESWLRYSKLI